MLRIISFGATAIIAGAAVCFPLQAAAANSYPPLPETVTSFGAVTCDGWLYAFGGHKGERHEYSMDMVSGSFQRLRLNGGTAWESLPSALPAQGVPLVAYKNSIYRIGGMAARNHPDKAQDLYSMAIVQRYDVGKGRWEDITPLPAVRSSHDAVILGDKLYVAGGWQLAGGTNNPAWPANALVMDLSQPQKGWKEFPQPFQRRALALAALGTRVYCLGGMDNDNKPTLAVEVYDTATGKWFKGPDLPAGRFKGFSCSAIAQDGRIYATTFKGDLFRLSSDGSAWEVVGKLEHPRLAHRLVTMGEKQLIVLGGEDGEAKRPDLELLTPSDKPLPAEKAESVAAKTGNPHE